MRYWSWILAIWVGATAVAWSANTTAHLVLEAETVRPGDTVLAGVVLEMAPGWHTYWRNPGESGMATEIEWTLPNGVTAGSIHWPIPHIEEAGGLITYALYERAVLVVPLTFSDSLSPGPLTIKAEVSWLECQQLCLPGDATVEARLTVDSTTRPSADAALLADAMERQPTRDSTMTAIAAWEGLASGDKRPLALQVTSTENVEEAHFFPYETDGFSISPHIDRQRLDEAHLTFRTEVETFGDDWPREVAGIIVVGHGETATATELTAAIQESPDAPPASVSTTGTAARPAGGGLVFNLLLALGGGLILNLMPCVLPILSLKVLSLVRQGGSTPGERRKHGLVYTLGVLVSFWAVGGLVIAGSLTSWGGQFQDPRFIVLITVLMTVVALNLFGVFEVILPGATVTEATQLASKEGVAGSFFNGVLAVVLGASCVAPLLAAAIGWAISKPPLVIFLSFTMIGLGLALPFLLLSFFPVLQALLPKPGPWMEKFKVAMGFPMLATAAWLLSLTSDHFGAAGPLWIGLFLVVFAMALWIYGEFVQRGTRRRALATVIALLVAVGAYAGILENRLSWRNPATPAPGANGGKTSVHPAGLDWLPWSPETIADARAAGRPVLVDFTANWCVTCNTVVKPALEHGEVVAQMKARNVVPLVADFTLKDPAILSALRTFQRAGVPLVVVYPADPALDPLVLPDPNPLFPTRYRTVILDALARLQP